MGKHYKELYAVSIALLALVLIFGSDRGGAKSTFNLGILDLQVIEVVKITFILSYAKIIENHRGKLNTLKEIFDVVIYAVPVIGLIIVEPDLGGAIIFCCIVFGMIFSAGINRKILMSFSKPIAKIILYNPKITEHTRVNLTSQITCGIFHLKVDQTIKKQPESNIIVLFNSINFHSYCYIFFTIFQH